MLFYIYLVQSYEYIRRYDARRLWCCNHFVHVFVFSDADAWLDLLVYFRSFAWSLVVVQLFVIMTLLNASGMQPLEHLHSNGTHTHTLTPSACSVHPNLARFNAISPWNFHMKNQKPLVFLSIPFWFHSMWHGHMMQFTTITHTITIILTLTVHRNRLCWMLCTMFASLAGTDTWDVKILCSNYNHAYSVLFIKCLDEGFFSDWMVDK